MTAAVAVEPARFDIFGARIAVHTNERATGDRIAGALDAYATTAGDDVCASFYIEQRDSQSPFRVGQLFSNRTLLVVADNHKLITAALGALPWRLDIHAYQRTDDYVYGYLFDPLFLMVMKRRDLVHAHAAAVCSDAGTVLIVGGSGAGKSTTTLSLLLHGYRFIADDELFLQSTSGGVYARGGERFAHFADTTAALLRGLPPVSTLPLVQRGTRTKRQLDVAFFRPTPATEHSRTAPPIRAVLFPQVDPAAITHLKPIASTETMRRLILQRPKEHPASMPDAPSLERQFATCAALAESAPAFALTLGREIAGVPRLIDAAIA